MGDKATRGCREARDLNSIFPQLNNVSNGAGAHTLAREVEVVSPKGAVPVRVSLADVLNVSGERARGHGWEREEEESGLVRVVSKEVRGQKRVVEEGVIYQWWLDWWWWVDEDFEVSEHSLVVGINGGFGEVHGRVAGGCGWLKEEEEEDEEEEGEKA